MKVVTFRQIQKRWERKEARDYAEAASRAIGMGLRFRPELVVLSPLSLLSLIREARLSRRVSPLSESTERLAPCPALTAFLRCKGGETGDAGLLLPFFEGERVKRGSQEVAVCDEFSASEPRVDVDQRDRRVRSGGTREMAEGERCRCAELSRAAEACLR